MALLPERFKKHRPIGPPPGEPKKPVIAIGISTKKPDDADDPDDPMDAAMPPKGASDALTPPAAGGDEPDADDQDNVMSPEEAIVLRSGDKTCQSCKNWEPTDGSCSVVPEASPLDSEDRCLRGYSPLTDEGNPDEGDDDQGSDAMPKVAASPAGG